MNTENVNNRRFNGFDPKEPELVGLTDCVDAMADRAEAVLLMLMERHTSEEDSLTWASMDAVLQEVRDIKGVLTSYYEFTRRKEISEAEKDESPAK